MTDMQTMNLRCVGGPLHGSVQRVEIPFPPPQGYQVRLPLPLPRLSAVGPADIDLSKPVASYAAYHVGTFYQRNDMIGRERSISYLHTVDSEPIDAFQTMLNACREPVRYVRRSPRDRGVWFTCDADAPGATPIYE